MFGSVICPYCKEKIKKGAVICRYCRKELAASHGDDSCCSFSAGIAAGVLGLAFGAFLPFFFGFMKERRRWQEEDMPWDEGSE